jgi:hypothetical protein
MSQRTTLARVDDSRRRIKIAGARRIIYEGHHQVNSTAVENILQDESWVPTMVGKLLYLIAVKLTQKFLQNAFSDRLSSLGFDLFEMLLPDLMHEFELGTWKSVFIHLIRILQSVDEKLIIELDRR